MDVETQSAAPARERIRERLTTTGDTVVVACKQPNGLILRVFDWVEYEEPNSGGKTKKIARQSVEAGEYEIHGNAIDMAALQRGEVNHRIVGGYGITHGIPKDFWDRWLEENKDSRIVKNGLVLAWPTEQGAVDESRNREKLRSGLEPIDPDRPPRDVARVKRGTMNNDDVDNL